MRYTRRFSALLALAAVAITGCASQDYAQYTQARAAEARARAEADVARYNALARIAETGSDAARVAAVMSLQAAGNGQNVTTPTAAPRSAADTALGWASVLVPGLTQMHAATQATRLGLRQSDNAAAVATSTNATMLGLGGLIQAPGATTTYDNSFNDSTHAPTVVTQPPPLVVVQPEPIVVTQPQPVVVRR